MCRVKDKGDLFRFGRTDFNLEGTRKYVYRLSSKPENMFKSC